MLIQIKHRKFTSILQLHLLLLPTSRFSVRARVRPGCLNVRQRVDSARPAQLSSVCVSFPDMAHTSKPCPVAPALDKAFFVHLLVV